MTEEEKFMNEAREIRKAEMRREFEEGFCEFEHRLFETEDFNPED